MASNNGNMDEQRVYEPDQLTQAALLEMQQCIETVTKKKFKYPEDIQKSLADGVLLCEFLNGLKQGCIRKINRLPTPIAGIDNLNVFLDACRVHFALKDSQLFDSSDLQDLSTRAIFDCEADLKYEQDRRLRRVAITIFWLSKATAVKSDFSYQFEQSAFAKLIGGGSSCLSTVTQYERTKAKDSFSPPRRTVVPFVKERVSPARLPVTPPKESFSPSRFVPSFKETVTRQTSNESTDASSAYFSNFSDNSKPSSTSIVSSSRSSPLHDTSFDTTNSDDCCFSRSQSATVEPIQCIVGTETSAVLATAMPGQPNGQVSASPVGYQRRNSYGSDSGSNDNGIGYSPNSGRRMSQQGSFNGASRTSYLQVGTNVAAAEPLKLVKGDGSKLAQQAKDMIDQMEKQKEVKKTLRQQEDDWQDDLSSWKSKMRQKSGKTFQRVQESQDVVLNDGEETGKRRSKTFKEMMADREQRGGTLYLSDDTVWTQSGNKRTSSDSSPDSDCKPELPSESANSDTSLTSKLTAKQLDDVDFMSSRANSYKKLGDEIFSDKHISNSLPTQNQIVSNSSYTNKLSKSNGNSNVADNGYVDESDDDNDDVINSAQKLLKSKTRTYANNINTTNEQLSLSSYEVVSNFQNHYDVEQVSSVNPKQTLTPNSLLQPILPSDVNKDDKFLLIEQVNNDQLLKQDYAHNEENHNVSWNTEVTQPHHNSSQKGIADDSVVMLSTASTGNNIESATVPFLHADDGVFGAEEPVKPVSALKNFSETTNASQSIQDIEDDDEPPPLPDAPPPVPNWSTLPSLVPHVEDNNLVFEPHLALDSYLPDTKQQDLYLPDAKQQESHSDTDLDISLKRRDSIQQRKSEFFGINIIKTNQETKERDKTDGVNEQPVIKETTQFVKSVPLSASKNFEPLVTSTSHVNKWQPMKSEREFDNTVEDQVEKKREIMRQKMEEEMAEAERQKKEREKEEQLKLQENQLGRRLINHNNSTVPIPKPSLTVLRNKGSEAQSSEFDPYKILKDRRQSDFSLASKTREPLRASYELYSSQESSTSNTSKPLEPQSKKDLYNRSFSEVPKSKSDSSKEFNDIDIPLMGSGNLTESIRLLSRKPSCRSDTDNIFQPQKQNKIETVCQPQAQSRVEAAYQPQTQNNIDITFLPQTQNRVEEIQVIRPVIYPKVSKSPEQLAKSNLTREDSSSNVSIGQTAIPYNRSSRSPSPQLVARRASWCESMSQNRPSVNSAPPANRKVLHELCAVPKQRYIENNQWMVKTETNGRKSATLLVEKQPSSGRLSDILKQNTMDVSQHWLVEEAERRRLADQRFRKNNTDPKSNVNLHAQMVYGVTNKLGYYSPAYRDQHVIDQRQFYRHEQHPSTATSCYTNNKMTHMISGQANMEDQKVEQLYDCKTTDSSPLMPFEHSSGT